MTGAAVHPSLRCPKVLCTSGISYWESEGNREWLGHRLSKRANQLWIVEGLGMTM